MDNLTNVPFRDESDWKINTEIVFDDETDASFSFIDKARKKVVYISAELHKGRHAFEIYDVSNCVPYSVHSSKFDYCSAKSARNAGIEKVWEFPILDAESSLDKGN